MPGERTEKPTQRKLEKARREGNFASSRELIGAGQFLVFVSILSAWSVHLLAAICATMRRALTFDHPPELDALGVSAEVRSLAAHVALPLLGAGGVLVLLSLGAQLVLTRFGFALKKLAPDFTRLNPTRKLKSILTQNLPTFFQALILIPVCLLVVWQFAKSNLPAFLALEFVPPAAGIVAVVTAVEALLWKAAIVLVFVGILDLIRQKRTMTKDLMMSKHDIREEAKETEGNPQIKMRIRRIQRDLARRSMMKEVPNATAVVVNPTHFAVAIRYDMASMAAPRVVAKGKNYLALRIRQIAIENQVPIVENKPLAQGLYKAVDVGQEIPAHLYKAVAEILAYIYRLMNPKGRQA